MKNFIRKIAAVGTSVALLGMTVGGAVALDLGDLETGAPFIENGAYANTAFVVGMTAGTNDDLARLKLVNYFGDFITASEDYTYNADDDAEDDLVLDTSDLSGFGEIDSGMIDTLFEDDIDVDDTDYTTREVIFFTADTDLHTSYHADGQEEFGDTPYLVYGAGAINYGYNFTDYIPGASVTEDETLDLTFLGKEIEITNITDAGIILDIMDQVSLDTGESYEYKGHTITLVRVYSSSASVDVDGEEKLITDGNSKDFGDDITVEVDALGEATDPTQSSAVLKVSEQGVDSTVGNNDAFELFVDYDTNSHSPWVWNIVTVVGDNLTYLGIDNRWDIDDLEPSQDYHPLPITVGESVVFPNNYAALVWDSVTTDTYADFTVTIDESKDLDDEDDTGIIVDDKAMVIFSSSNGDYFELDGTDYHTVYMVNNASSYTDGTLPTIYLWGEDDDGYHYTTASSFVINYNDDDKDITINNVTATNYSTDVNITANDWGITFPWNYSTDYFGFEEGVDEAADLEIDSATIGTREYDILLADGSIVLDPDSGFGSDKLDFKIPNQDVDATFKVYTVATTSEVEAVLKADSAATGYDNLILVGGPCVNSLTADYLGVTYPACEADSNIPEEQAIIQLVEKDDTVALIVAGWEKEETVNAAIAVAAGDLTGTSLVV